MLRLLWGAFALACGAAQAIAGSPTPPDDSASAPMRFEWRREGPADVCGAHCRTWISATGYITADTPREFEAFAKDPQNPWSGAGARFRRRLGAGHPWRSAAPSEAST